MSAGFGGLRYTPGKLSLPYYFATAGGTFPASGGNVIPFTVVEAKGFTDDTSCTPPATGLYEVEFYAGVSAGFTIPLNNLEARLEIAGLGDLRGGFATLGIQSAAGQNYLCAVRTILQLDPTNVITFYTVNTSGASVNIGARFFCRKLA